MDDAILVTNERKNLATLEIMVFVLLLVLMFALAGQISNTAASPDSSVAEAVDDLIEEHLPYCYSECGFVR